MLDDLLRGRPDEHHGADVDLLRGERPRGGGHLLLRRFLEPLIEAPHFAEGNVLANRRAPFRDAANDLYCRGEAQPGTKPAIAPR